MWMYTFVSYKTIQFIKYANINEYININVNSYMILCKVYKC